MITTDDQKLARKAQLLRNHGETQKYHHETLGYNYRMTEFCVAIGSTQLKKLDESNDQRKVNAKLLSNRIRNFKGLTAPYVDKDMKHVFHHYVVKIKDNYARNRNELFDSLTEKGVGVAVYYPLPIYRQPLYQKLDYKETVCPVTEKICKQVLSIPVHPMVDRKDIEYILDSLKEIS